MLGSPGRFIDRGLGQQWDREVDQQREAGDTEDDDNQSAVTQTFPGQPPDPPGSNFFWRSGQLEDGPS